MTTQQKFTDWWDSLASKWDSPEAKVAAWQAWQFVNRLQPEQEPDDLTIAYMAGFSRGKDAAPQRKPLTDEEFYAIARKSGFDVELMKSNKGKGMPSIAEIFGRAIEAAHGIKE